MANERKTEMIFRNLVRNKGFYDNNKITLEEQKSDNPKINKLLKNASKKGNGKGFPEFIITHRDFQDLIIVVECKAEIKFHKSENFDKYDKYAVDGVLLYASYLSKEYDVISIALSGEEDDNYLFDTYFTPKSGSKFTILSNPKTESEVREILSFDDYDSIIHYNPEKEKVELEKIMKFADTLHNYMRDNIGLTEQEKPLLVSAIMLALQDEAFKNSYSIHEDGRANKLTDKLVEAVTETLINSGIPESKVINMSHTFGFIQSNEGLKHKNINNVSNLYHVTKEIDSTLSPFMEKYVEHDIVGKFYGEFISYTGGDGKGLGVVLTPKHITEFMCEIIGVDENSVVLDTCTGTGAFLITAMNRMFKKANKIEHKKNREIKIENIKRNQLVGVEKLSHMYAMVCANMIFRGDGKSNIFNGSCFDFKDNIKKLKPTHAVINPPYSQSGVNLQEIDFIQYTLDCLENGGKMACIVPMSVAIGIKKGQLPKREKLLSSHRLDAVLSMPNQLFEPYAATNTCIMVFTAHKSHFENEYHETFFGYYKEDGHKLTRKGRLDFGDWKNIESKWYDLYFRKKGETGLSTVKKVTFNEEWCSEAYMNTDYSTITEDDFIETLKQYAGFKLINSHLFSNGEDL